MRIIALLCLLLVSCAQQLRTDKPVAINTSGVMKYHWSKGWLVDTPSRRVAVTCSHSNPATGVMVGFKDAQGAMVFVMVREVFAVESQGGASDVSVLLLAEPAPPWAMAYSYPVKVRNGDKVKALTQLDTLVSATIGYDPDAVMSVLDNKSGQIISGDSGLPWFNAKGRIVGHNTSSAASAPTFGPVYASPLILPSFSQRILEAEAMARPIVSAGL